MELLTDPQAWIALATLTALELVLGIDNIIFITILTGALPRERRRAVRLVGLSLAMGMRIALLLVLAWIIGLTAPLLTVLGQEVSGRDLILLGGGLFLLYKSTHEIHKSVEGTGEGARHGTAASSVAGVLAQVVALDIVFSLDSVITAVGMVEQVEIMVAAIVLAVLLMMVSSEPLARFVDARPTVKVLALAFLLLVGTALVADGLDVHIPRGYLYFAMAYSMFVEMLHLRMQRRREEAVRA